MHMISHTFLEAYKKCQKMAWLQYIKKVIPNEKIDKRNFLVGIVADWLFKKWATDMEFQPGWMETKSSIMYDWFESKNFVRYKGWEDRPLMKRKLQESTQKLEECVFELKFDEKRMDLQRSFKYSEDGVDFYGKMDIWFPDEKQVVDLKITKYKKWLKPEQLQFYTWIMRKNNLEVNSAHFLSPLMPIFYIEEDISLSAVELFEEDMWKTIELIRNENWEETAKDCWGCPVEQFCTIPEEDFIVDSKPNKIGGFSIDLGNLKEEK